MLALHRHLRTPLQAHSIHPSGRPARLRQTRLVASTRRVCQIDLHIQPAIILINPQPAPAFKTRRYGKGDTSHRGKAESRVEFERGIGFPRPSWRRQSKEGEARFDNLI